MTRRPGNMTRAGWLAVAVAVGVAAAFLPITAERAAPREMVLVARNMAFYLEGETAPNPEIRVSRDTRVALTFRNDDAGIVHDFAIPAWGVSTGRLRAGESERIVFTVPATAGSTGYVCNPHPAMMYGVVVVE